MDQCTHEVRAEYWKKIIHACGQRPAGLFFARPFCIKLQKLFVGRCNYIL